MTTAAPSRPAPPPPADLPVRVERGLNGLYLAWEGEVVTGQGTIRQPYMKHVGPTEGHAGSYDQAVMKLVRLYRDLEERHAAALAERDAAVRDLEAFAEAARADEEASAARADEESSAARPARRQR